MRRQTCSTLRSAKATWKAGENVTGPRFIGRPSCLPAEITYEFDNMHVKIPSGTGANATHAEWILNGAMKIRTRDAGASPN